MEPTGGTGRANLSETRDFVWISLNAGAMCSNSAFATTLEEGRPINSSRSYPSISQKLPFGSRQTPSVSAITIPSGAHSKRTR